MGAKKRVNVRGHTRKWPKRWDMRLFLVVDDYVYIIPARSPYEAAKRLGADIQDVVTYSNQTLERFVPRDGVKLKEA